MKTAGIVATQFACALASAVVAASIWGFFGFIFDIERSREWIEGTGEMSLTTTILMFAISMSVFLLSKQITKNATKHRGDRASIET